LARQQQAEEKRLEEERQKRANEERLELEMKQAREREEEILRTKQQQAKKEEEDARIERERLKKIEDEKEEERKRALQQQQQELQEEQLDEAVDEEEDGNDIIINGERFEILQFSQARYDYTHPDPDPNFLCFKANDVFRVIFDESEFQGWRLALNAQNNKGFVPGNFLKPISEDEFYLLSGTTKKLSKKAQLQQIAKEDEEKEKEALRLEEERKKGEELKKQEEQKRIEEEEKAEKERKEKEKREKAQNKREKELQREDSKLQKSRSEKHKKKEGHEGEVKETKTVGKTYAEAKFDYVHPDASSTEFFSFKTGDRFTVLLNSPDLKGWTIVLNSKNEKGFVPGNYLTIFPPEEVSKKDKDKNPKSPRSQRSGEGNATSKRKDLQRTKTENPDKREQKNG